MAEIAPLRGPRIVLAAYDLALDLYPAIRSFPKSQQFVIGARIQDAALAVLAGLTAANAAGDKRRKLLAVNEEVDKLRLLVRLAFDLKFLGMKRYAALSERIDEVGRMLGGWMKWTDKPEAGR